MNHLRVFEGERIRALDEKIAIDTGVVHIVAQARNEDGQPLKGPLALDNGRIHHDEKGVVRY
jgi:hypothetical protein